MATLHKELVIAAPRELVWGALRDVGALHTRLVPGFVVDTHMENADVRVVTFGNGMVLREPILSVDDLHYRIAWAAVGGPMTHYNSSIEVYDEPDGSRVVWVTDFLPNELASTLAEMQDDALVTMKNTLEAAAALRTIAPWSFEISFPVRR
ncbi:MAG: SRPBCC family protein [Kofleriaceae bacterium]|nr:SRPBCC family protein [Kofleriaceae bacterium]